MRHLKAALLAGALSIPALSTPAQAGPLRAQVLEQLDGIEDPPSPQALRALGSGVASELIELSQDESVSVTRRLKALHALGYFPSPETRAVLAAALEGSDERMARKAVYALGNGWGDEAVPLIEKALQAENVQLRIAAARSLGNVGTSKARAVLDRRLPTETVPAVRESIEKSLARPVRQ